MTNFLGNIADKFKGFFNIGNVEVKLECPEVLKRASQGEFSGKVIVTAKKEVVLESVKIELTETYQKGKPGESNYVLKTFTLGTEEIKLDKMTLGVAESKTVPYNLAFRLVENLNDRLKTQGGLAGGLGKLGSLMDSEKSDFSVTAMVFVAGSSFPVTNHKKVEMK